MGAACRSSCGGKASGEAPGLAPRPRSRAAQSSCRLPAWQKTPPSGPSERGRRHRRSQASRACSYPASKITRMSGSPSRHSPASISRGDDLADLACGHRGQVVSRAQPDRVQQPGPDELRPGSSAATNEYGQPGSSALCPSPARSRGCTTAPPAGRSTASRSTKPISHPPPADPPVLPQRPQAAGHASDQRSRATSTRPQFTASYSAPCPRRCPGASDSPASTRTGPSAHSTASASSNSSSTRAVKQP